MWKSDGKCLQRCYLPIRNFRGIAWRLDYEQKELQAKEWFLNDFEWKDLEKK